MILALDQATRTGWAKGEPCGPVTCGSFSIWKAGDNIGRAMLMFKKELEALLDDVDLIVFEEPIRPFKTSIVTLQKLYCIAGMIEVVGLIKGIETAQVHNKTCKKTVYGSGGKKPSEAVAIHKIAKRGITVTNGDEADAAAVFIHTVMVRFPEDAENFDPLFRSGKDDELNVG